jgi:mono/diheme cytochrome c family protein
MGIYSRTLLSTLVIASLLVLSTTVAQSQSTTSKADTNNVKQVERGKKIYMRFCSFCHGRNLEGQPQWHLPKPDGKMPAPPHDESGHTWHHADIVLFNITKYGLVPPHAPEGYQSDMPAWKDTLQDEDIWAVLAFIKSRWPKENLEFQQNVTENYKPF